MKMFLTRLGFGSKMVVTGDQTQIGYLKVLKVDLRKLVSRLHNVKGISILKLDQSDVVRHPLVVRSLNIMKERIKCLR